MGASALYHLARAGCADTLLIERATLGAGSTSKAAGGIRAQFSDELNIRIAVENIRRFERFGAEVGADIDFKQWGYLFLLLPEDVEAFATAVELQRSLGVPSELLTAEAALEIIPHLDLSAIAAATFCPTDGYATPEAVAQGYAAAAVGMGARIVQGTEAVAVDVDGGRVAAVQTSTGRVATPTVICTAGVWSPQLAATVGLHLPVSSQRRHVWLTTRPDPLRHRLPLTIDFATGFYFQREGNRILFGGKHQSIEELAPAATSRLPALEDLPIRYGWWGFYAMSPDHNAIVGRARSPAGFLYATGFSGHGFQQSPVVGEYLADLALHRPPVFDLSPLSVERFATEELKPEGHVV